MLSNVLLAIVHKIQIRLLKPSLGAAKVIDTSYPVSANATNGPQVTGGKRIRTPPHWLENSPNHNVGYTKGNFNECKLNKVKIYPNPKFLAIISVLFKLLKAS